MGKEHKHGKNGKERKRQRTPSSSSSDDEQTRRLEKRLAAEREAKRREKRKQKEEMKANETPEEKRLRRMQKKIQKDEKRRKAESEDALIPAELNYTNLNNPFNDPKLTQTFVWEKKLERDGQSGLTQEEVSKLVSQNIRKNLTEAAEFKRIRDSRAAAREDAEMMKRDADMRAGMMTDEKERQFQMNQVKERSRIRIDQGRAKAIDMLSRYARFIDGEQIPDFEFENPLEYIKTTCKTADDLEDLIEDIRTYRKLDGWTKNDVWWNDIQKIVEDEFAKQNPEILDERGGILQEVQALFVNKTIDELVKLLGQVQERLHEPSGNTSYWQKVESRLEVFIARKRTREHHNRQLRLQLARIKEEQRKEIQKDEQLQDRVPVEMKMKGYETEEEDEEIEEEDEEKMAKKVRRKIDVAVLDDPELDEQERERKWRALTVDQLEDVTLELYRIGCYSPPYSSFDDVMPGIDIIDEKADQEILIERQRQNRQTLPSGSGSQGAGTSDATDPKMLAIARKGMEGDESMFSVEEKLETQKHLWSDKYRPRKPTYLNRVQTGFDWNKYNQTHYDQDNPPPKIVQGYKFNIFYPDLLDVTKTPSFTITPADDRDFAVIRFKSGPPYEDIAFKVVNREWETLYKNGYKCQFQNGVFQLWFMFKKYRYRR